MWIQCYCGTKLTRALVVALAAPVLALLIGMGSAEAAAPAQFRLSFPFSTTDTTSCAFPISINLQIKIVGRVYLDNAGNVTGMTLEQSATGTDSANGITLTENDHWVDMTNALGSDQEVGLPIHLQAAGGGLVIRDAGYLLFNPDGSIAIINGPHPVIEGDTAPVCAALN
jgi:hypothetical protein